MLAWLAENTYLVVFFGTLIDATGFPFPGRLLLVAAGALVTPGETSVVIIIALAAVAAMLVDQLWYLGLRRGSGPLFKLYCRMTGRERGCQADDGEYFARYGAASIVLGRFFTSVRVLAWPFAAAHGVGYWRFVLLDAVGAAAWAATWVLLGWFVGEHWRWAAETFGVWAGLTSVLVLLAFAAPLALRLLRRRARARLQAASAPRGSAAGACRESPGVPRARPRP